MCRSSLRKTHHHSTEEIRGSNCTFVGSLSGRSRSCGTHVQLRETCDATTSVWRVSPSVPLTIHRPGWMSSHPWILQDWCCRERPLLAPRSLQDCSYRKQQAHKSTITNLLVDKSELRDDERVICFGPPAATLRTHRQLEENNRKRAYPLWSRETDSAMSPTSWWMYHLSLPDPEPGW